MALTLIGVVAVAVRVAGLTCDPPRSLSWSSGVYTDEGFYSLDARHLSQFGSLPSGDFHDRIVSPLLTLSQLAAFRILGPSLVAARTVSVVFGLAAIAIVWCALRAHGARAAAAGALLLALLPPAVFYSRLALQETPAACCLALALLFATLGDRPAPTAGRWWALAGVAVVLALAFKMLAVLAVPGLIWAAAAGKRRGARIKGLGLGLAMALAVYGLIWLAPHRVDLGRMDRYYALHQAMPHSIARLAHNVATFWLDPVRGLGPYLLVSAGVAIVFALAPAPLAAMSALAEPDIGSAHSSSP